MAVMDLTMFFWRGAEEEFWKHLERWVQRAIQCSEINELLWELGR